MQNKMQIQLSGKLARLAFTGAICEVKKLAKMHKLQVKDAMIDRYLSGEASHCKPLQYIKKKLKEEPSL